MRVGCQIRLQTHRRHASAALGRLGGLTPESHHAYFQILPLPDYGLPAKIWNGWDAIHVEQNLGLSALAVTDAGAQLSEQPIVQIMGHYNSGTNLLVALLEKVSMAKQSPIPSMAHLSLCFGSMRQSLHYGK